jgi:hypothetical protein
MYKYINEILVAEEKEGSYALKKKILFVDQDITSYYLVTEILEQSHFEIVHVKDANTAIKACKKYSFDAVIMEMRITGMDGFSLLRELRNIKPNIPVIAQTAFLHFNIQKKCRKAGFNAFIAKPVNIQEFVVLVRKHVLLNVGGN